MDKEQRYILKKAGSYLVDNLYVSVTLWKDLETRNILTSEMVDDIEVGTQCYFLSTTNTHGYSQDNINLILIETYIKTVDLLIHLFKIVTLVTVAIFNTINYMIVLVHYS